MQRFAQRKNCEKENGTNCKKIAGFMLDNQWPADLYANVFHQGRSVFSNPNQTNPNQTIAQERRALARRLPCRETLGSSQKQLPVGCTRFRLRRPSPPTPLPRVRGRGEPHAHVCLFRHMFAVKRWRQAPLAHVLMGEGLGVRAAFATRRRATEAVAPTMCGRFANRPY